MQEMPEWTRIRNMSDSCLKIFLDKNTEVDPHLLAIISSEILRRQLTEANRPEMMRNELN